MLDTQTELLEQKSNMEESLPIITYIYSKFEEYGLINNNDGNNLIDLYQKYLEIEDTIRFSKLLPDTPNLGNIFCFLILKGFPSMEYGIGSIPFNICFFLIWAASLSGHYELIPLLILPTILFAIFGIPAMIINVFSPIKFWNIILLDNDCDSWSVGLKGYIYEPNSLHLIGFKGLRIKILGQSNYYYIGHTLAILTE